MPWPALDPATLRARVHAALDRNRSYADGDILGLPGTFLDQRVFPASPAVRALPFLRTLLENPNHIGCHTLGPAEPAFAGTHDLEREVVRLCAEELLGAAPGTVDGYVASGGTESNIQAMWAARNHWRAAGVDPAQIAILCTTDTHYSLHKAADLLGIGLHTVALDRWGRQPTAAGIAAALDAFAAAGHTHAAVVLTMGTTMFGTVEQGGPLLAALDRRGIPSLVHVDAAFGGFVYPLTVPDQPLGFHDPRVSTVTLDAHKMLQAPYGTGIHLARKGLLAHTRTETAAYVPGLDCTLSGSRSGANAVAVWMILQTWGHEGGRRFVQALADRAAWLAQALRDQGRHPVHTPGMNIVVLPEHEVPPALSARFLLVADDHAAPSWRKIVVMEHVDRSVLARFLAALAAHPVPPAAPAEG